MDLENTEVVVSEADLNEESGKMDDTSTSTPVSNELPPDEKEDGMPVQDQQDPSATEAVPEEKETAPEAETADIRQIDGEKEDEEGVECGFLVDRISTIPYQKAMERGEVPFCAFAPISTPDFYLLRIQDCSDMTRHMLVPASKEEVMNIPGALKIMEEDQEPGNDDALNYRVTIVGIARQVYSEEDKQLVVSVDPLLKKDKKKISSVRFLTPDKFADFAFLGFDGNISEFTNKTETVNKENRRPSMHHLQQSSTKISQSPHPVPRKAKSPPKAPIRRGRGGRRKQSRKSPPMPASHRGQGQTAFHHPAADRQPQMYASSMQQLQPVSFSQGMGPGQHTITFVTMEGGDHEGQFVTPFPISQFQDTLAYSQDAFTVPIQFPQMMKSDLQVPIPVNEVTVSTTEEGENQQTSHDIITIAFDQLVNMTNGAFDCNPCAAPSQVERGAQGGRGGRRPGRKPGRKPTVKEKVQDIDENTTFGQLLNMNEPVAPGPKRRGRPPKIRLPLPVADQENVVPMVEEEFEKQEKRVKLQPFE